MADVVEVQSEETQVEKESPLSQRDFRPTPYMPSSWEYVGERISERNFLPLEMSIIATDSQQPDPMFEVFGPECGKENDLVWHIPDTATYAKTRVQEPEVSSTRPASEAELAESFTKGLEQGREEGRKEGCEEADRLTREVAERVEQFQRDLNERVLVALSQMQQEAVKLALSVARKILATTAEAKPEYILEVIAKAMAAKGAATALRVRVAPQDLEFIRVVGMPAELSESELGVKFIADESVASGCVVETDFGEIDLQLDTMWEAVKERLYEVMK